MILKSDRLTVTVADPKSVSYQTRFDHAGFVLQVVLDNRHTFCERESTIGLKGCYGQGLCSEYGLLATPGHDDTKVGEYFPKFGAGLLLKHTEQDYSFSDRFALTPSEISVRADDHRATFVTSPQPCMGFAAELTRTISITHSTLTMTNSIRNCGEKAFEVAEYCHNFMAIDGTRIGPAYRFSSSVPTELETRPDMLSDTDGLRMPIPDPLNAFYHRSECVEGTADFSWTLVHTPSNVGVRVTERFKASVFALWAEQHVISPEVFKPIALKPGESDSWSREYEFFVD